MIFDILGMPLVQVDTVINFTLQEKKNIYKLESWKKVFFKLVRCVLLLILVSLRQYYLTSISCSNFVHLVTKPEKLEMERKKEKEVKELCLIPLGRHLKISLQTFVLS